MNSWYLMQPKSMDQSSILGLHFGSINELKIEFGCLRNETQLLWIFSRQHVHDIEFETFQSIESPILTITGIKPR